MSSKFDEVPNKHGKKGWCHHFSKKTSGYIEFTSSDNTEIHVVSKKECIECPYCGARRPINI